MGRQPAATEHLLRFGAFILIVSWHFWTVFTLQGDTTIARASLFLSNVFHVPRLVPFSLPSSPSLPCLRVSLSFHFCSELLSRSRSVFAFPSLLLCPPPSFSISHISSSMLFLQWNKIVTLSRKQENPFRVPGPRTVPIYDFLFSRRWRLSFFPQLQAFFERMCLIWLFWRCATLFGLLVGENCWAWWACGHGASYEVE